MPSNLCQYCGWPKNADGTCKCTVTSSIETPAQVSSMAASLPEGWAKPSTAPLGPKGGSGDLPQLAGAEGGAVSKLVVLEGPYSGRTFALSGPVVTIGREVGRDILLLTDSRASRNHARLTLEDNAYTIYDNNSSNGTYVNKVRVSAQKLAPGDIISIGETKFRAEA